MEMDGWRNSANLPSRNVMSGGGGGGSGGGGTADNDFWNVPSEVSPWSTALDARTIHGGIGIDHSPPPMGGFNLIPEPRFFNDFDVDQLNAQFHGFNLSNFPVNNNNNYHQQQQQQQIHDNDVVGNIGLLRCTHDPASMCGGGGGGVFDNNAFMSTGRAGDYIDASIYSYPSSDYLLWRRMMRAESAARGMASIFDPINPNFNNRSPSHSQFCNHRLCNPTVRNNHSECSSSRLSQSNYNYSTIDNVNLMARSQPGRRNLQKILDEKNPEKIQMIVSQIRHHVHDLMKHQTGNNFIQNLFEVCNPQQITELVRFLVNDQRHLLNVCMDRQGTRAMQNILGYLKSHEQKKMMLTCLRIITFPLTKDANGHHVIQRCLDLYPPEDTLQILNVIAENCVDIAADKSGCCLLQHCFLKSVDVQPLKRIEDEIASNALFLACDPYGNFVVQFIVGLKKEKTKMEILAQLSGHFVALSKDKYGSHVVEKFLHNCSEDQAMCIIQELITSQEFLTLLQDPFGNFVAQSALTVSYKIRDMIIPIILMHHRSLQSHPHGKKVLERINGYTPQQDRRSPHVDANKSSRNCMH